MDREQLQGIAQPPLGVRDVFYDEPRVDDIAVIRVDAPCAAGHGVGIMHRRHEPERLDVLSPHEAFRKPEPHPNLVAGRRPRGEKPPGTACVPNH